MLKTFSTGALALSSLVLIACGGTDDASAPAASSESQIQYIWCDEWNACPEGLICQESPLTAGRGKCVRDSFSAPRAIDLGEIAKPGAVLGGNSYSLRVGDSVSFRTRINQIQGIAGWDVQPENLVRVSDELIRGGSALGSTRLHRYTFTVSAAAQPGDEIEVASLPTYQSRDDAAWAFSFRIAVSR